MDGVFGVGVSSSIDTKNTDKASIYSRMLNATNNVQGQKVQEMSAFKVKVCQLSLYVKALFLHTV